MSYTKTELESKNKGQVVDIALQLSEKLEVITSGPITSDRIKAEMLSLKKQAVDIAAKREAEKEEHERAIKEIQAETEKQIKSLQLKYAVEDGTDIKELDKHYKKLQDEATKAIKDLTFGLEQAEHDAKMKLEKINEKVDKAEEEYEELTTSLGEKTTQVKETYQETINRLRTEHNRNMEQIAYDQKIALRDKNQKFAEEVAKALNLALVDEDELNILKQTQEMNEKEIANQIEEAVNEATSKVHRSEGAKYSSLKSSTEKEIALLEADKKYLTQGIQSAEARIKDLEAKLAQVPAQIKDAVAAAKADVKINQDAGKK